jgi:hypothetical protein
MRQYQLRRWLEGGFTRTGRPEAGGYPAVTEKRPFVASILIDPKCATSLPNIPSQLIRLEAGGS